jgi:hypothetical protein
MASNNYASHYINSNTNNYGNVMCNIIGPLNNHAPNVSGIKNLGVLNGLHPNPSKFGVADNSSEFSNSRHYYSNTSSSIKQQMIARERAISSTPSSFYSVSNQKQYSTSTHMNYIQPISSGQRMAILKSQSIGKSSYKIGLPTQSPLSFKSYDKNDVKSSLRHARSSGCIVPKKCGAIYSNTCRVGGGICNSKAIRS